MNIAERICYRHRCAEPATTGRFAGQCKPHAADCARIVDNAQLANKEN